MYKIFVRFNYEDIIKGYYEDLSKAQAEWDLWKDRYSRQGYTEDITETKTSEEWVYTVTRIPFYGSSGDPGTGEVTETPTGMTDTIEIHLELGNKSYTINDWKISYPVNYAKLWAMGKVVPVTPGPTPTGKYLVSASAINGTVTGGGYYDEGATCTLTVTPDSGYNFASWDDGSTENPRSFTVTGNVTLVATCTSVPVYTLTFLATNGTCEPSSFTGTVGSTVSVTVTPNEGLVFHHWDDGSQMNPRTFTVGPESKTYTATCQTPTMRTITMTSIANCSVTVNGDPYVTPVQVIEGSSCVINCIPAEGYKFTKWQGDVIGLYTPFTFTVAAKNYTISPVVDHITYTLSFESNVYLTFTGAGTYNAGTSVEIKAIPNAHARFEKWWDDSEENPRTIVVNSNMRLSAVGHANLYQLTVQDALLNGLHSGTTTGSGGYEYGTMAPISFTPIEGKTNFGHWSDGGAINHSHRVEADETVTAYGVGIVQIHNEEATNGSIVIDPTSSWVYGDYAYVTFVPDEHYHFVSWQGGDTNNPRTILVDGPITASCIGILDQHMVTTQTEHFTIQGTVDGETYYDIPHAFDWNSVVTFRYIADAHYHFSKWDDESTAETVTRRITQDTSINLTGYADPQYTVTLHSEHGTVSGDGTYWEGEDVQVQVTFVDDGYQFKKWTGHDSSGWTIFDIHANVEDTVEYDPWHGLAITNFTTSTQVLTMKHTYGSTYTEGKVYWSKDRIAWNSWSTTSSSTTQDIQFQGLETYYIKGNVYGFNSSKYFRIYCYGADAKFDISGRVTSLADGVGNETPAVPGNNYYWGSLFQGFNGLRSVTDDLLPYTSGYAQCYFQMFYGCFNLTKAPRIKIQHATGTINDMFQRMFYGCTSLKEVSFDLQSGTSTSISYDMMKDVPENGTFYGTAAMHPETGTAEHKWSYGADGVPVGWTYENLPEE